MSQITIQSDFKISKYKDGAKLTVKDNYAVPVMDSGLVVFAGEKEGYGMTIVVQRPDNVEVWYANLDNANMSLYDYVKKGDIVGTLDYTLDGKRILKIDIVAAENVGEMTFAAAFRKNMLNLFNLHSK